jgi:hypothetical protein
MAQIAEDFPLACPGCGGDIRLIAFITDPAPIRKIPLHPRSAERWRKHSPRR